MTFRPWITIAVGLCLAVLTTGCEDEPKPKRKIESRKTIGETTQEVRNLKAELKKGGTKSDGKIHETDYLGVNAAAYRTSVAKIAQMRVQSDMQIYETINDAKVKSYDEFMEQIIKKGKAEGIQLPMLPYYQEYGYDEDTRELVVIEYPEKKKQMQEQSDKELGRK